MSLEKELLAIAPAAMTSVLLVYFALKRCFCSFHECQNSNADRKSIPIKIKTEGKDFIKERLY